MDEPYGIHMEDGEPQADGGPISPMDAASPVGSQVDGREVARRMIQATEAAAQAAASTASAVEMMRKQREDRAGRDTDWFKLLPKPGPFEPKSEGKLNLQQDLRLMGEPEKKRSMFLYGLLASRLRGRLLSVLRGVGESNGDSQCAHGLGNF